MKTVTTDATIELPPHLAKCPICGAKIYIDDMTAWTKDDLDGTWYAVEVSIQCETEPDIDGEDWWDWMNGHWSMPYVDWLPLTEQVLAWLKANYRFEMRSAQ